MHQIPLILVTGAAGFVGRAVVEYLRSLDLPVRAMVRKERDIKALEDLGCEVVLAELTDRESLIAAMNGIEKVYHIAAAFRQASIEDEVYRQVNIEGVRSVFEIAIESGVKRIVHCSTVGVHGDVEHSPGTEETPYAPGDIYQITKMEGEKVALEFFRSNKIGGNVIRPAMIYGPGDMRTLKLFRMIAKQRFFYVGDGSKHVHFIDVRDLAKSFYLAMEKTEINGEVFIISGARSLPLKEFATLVANHLGVKPPWLHLPVKPIQWIGSLCEAICVPLGIEPPIYRRRVDFYTKNRSFSSAKANKLLEFVPAQTLDGEISDICQSYQDLSLL